MKKLLFILLLLPLFGLAQTTYHMRYDSVRIYKQGGTGEFILENSTKGLTNGFLKNYGEGRTRFAYALDSVWIDGDSIRFRYGNTTIAVLKGGSSVKAWEGLTVDDDTVKLGGPWSAPAQLTTSRAIDLNLQKFFFQKGDTILDESFSDWNGDRNTPLGAVIIDSVGDTNNPGFDVLPKMGGSWTRIIRWNSTGRRMHNRYGWRFKYQYELSDSVRDQGDGGDYQSALISDKVLVPYPGSNTKRLYVSGHGTNSWLNANEGIPSLIGNTRITGNDSAYIYGKGFMKGVGSYLVMDGIKDTVEHFTWLSGSSYIVANNWIKKGYFIRPDVYWNRVDSIFFIYDTVSRSRSYQAGKWMIGKSALGTYALPHTLVVNGGTLLTDTINYHTNVASKYSSRSLVDKNYVDSSIAAAGGGGAAWGSITGTLSSQTDLQNALDDKLNKSTTSGSNYVTFDPVVSGSNPSVTVTVGSATKESILRLGSLTENISQITLAADSIKLDFANNEEIIDISDSADWYFLVKQKGGGDRKVAVAHWPSGTGGGSSVSLTQGFLHDTMTVSGVQTIIPKYKWWDDFLGSNSTTTGSAYLSELASGTSTDAARYGSPSSITGATGDGYGRATTGTTNTGVAAFQINTLTNQNEMGLVDYTKKYRVSFKGIIIPTLSDGTETFSVTFGFALNSSVNNSIVVEYTHSDNSGQWVCRSHAGTTPEATNTSVAVSDNTEYNIDIEFYNGEAKFWINGNLVATHSTSVPANGGAMRGPMARIAKSNGTTAREFFIDAIGLGIIK
jgi:hypothetical protein